MLRALLKTMRPRQWTKNAFLFAALVFDGKLFHLPDFLRTLAGFGLFCMISSAVYIFNDLLDVEADRQHPVKKNRPIASRKLPVWLALAAGATLTLLAIILGILLAWQFAVTILIYFVMILVYSKWLKHIPILDVLILAAGFVLRVHAGTTLIVVERFSPWLYVLMTLLALYLGFGKRRAELAMLSERFFHPAEGARWLHHSPARPIHYHRLRHHHPGIFLVHLFPAARRSHAHADNPLRNLCHLPVLVSYPGQADWR